MALATAGAEPLLQSPLAGEEAEALLEQRRRAVRDLNHDDALIQQATGIMEGAVLDQGLDLAPITQNFELLLWRSSAPPSYLPGTSLFFRRG